jgi:hypothetical protein
VDNTTSEVLMSDPKAVTDRCLQTWRARDAEAFAECYAEDATIVVPGGDLAGNMVVASPPLERKGGSLRDDRLACVWRGLAGFADARVARMRKSHVETSDFTGISSSGITS